MNNKKKNLAIICDVTNNQPAGVICSCPITGDIAFATEDKVLEEVLDIILDNKTFLHADENINNHVMISEDEIQPDDSYYLMAINYSLPLPWRMLGVTSTEGDVEEIVGNAIKTLKEGGVNLEEIN